MSDEDMGGHNHPLSIVTMPLGACPACDDRHARQRTTHWDSLMVEGGHHDRPIPPTHPSCAEGGAA